MNHDFTPADLAPEFQRVRERCKADPLYLGAHVLGYDYLLDPADFHRETADALLRRQDFLLLAPRNHIKTTLVDVVGTIHGLLVDPFERHLIASATITLASAVLREIMRHFTSNPRFRKIYPEYAVEEKDEQGNRFEFTVPCRLRSRERRAFAKEASIEVAGQDRVITGKHFDRIACTDLVVRENVPPYASEEQMLRTIEFFRTIAALLDPTNPHARRTVDGTRWEERDLYGLIEDDEAYERFRKIIVGIPEKDGVPQSIWKHMSQDILIQKKKEAGEWLWACNYLNRPLAGRDAVRFKREWFEFYDKEPEMMNVAITVDLAISDKSTADRTALVVSGVTPEHHLYVLAAHAGRWTPHETVDRIFDLAAVWHPCYVGIESVAWQKAMLFIMDREMRLRNFPVPLRELKPDGRKERRAWPLSNYAERYHIKVKESHKELIEEFVSFPVGRHDDFVDALAYRAQDLWAPTERVVERIVEQHRIEVPSTRKLTGDQVLAMVEKQREELLPWELSDDGF